VALIDVRFIFLGYHSCKIKFMQFGSHKKSFG
jgi:hypothetical protein